MPSSEHLTFWQTALRTRKKEPCRHMWHRHLTTGCPEGQQPLISPPDTTLPLLLGKDYIHAVHKLCDIHVYIYTERLGYVISVRFVHKRILSVLKMIPIPLHMNQNSFLYIAVGKSVLGIDRARQCYFTIKENELAQCKVLETGKYVCKQQHTLLSTAIVESCAVLLLQKRERPFL
jgi:hypothetical protein